MLLPLLLAAQVSAPTPNDPELMPLLDFQDVSKVALWRPVHDVVMGGVSRGTASVADGSVRFEGRLSLENNGGFASFRLGARLPDLSQHDGLRLRARGDGQVYKLSVRTDDGWDGVSWQAPFDTALDAWTTVDLAFEDLVPTRRGRLVPDTGPFDPSAIRQLGIVIADEQEGAFELELASIEAWRSDGDGDVAGTRAAVRARSRGLAAAIDAGADAAAILGSLRGRERVLVIASPGVLDSASSRQIGSLLVRGDDLAAREVRIVHLMGGRGGRLAGRTLSPDQVSGLREALGLPETEWRVTLYDKEGRLEGRWLSSVDPDAVLDSIDALSARRTVSSQVR